MQIYKAPLKDIKFLLYDFLDLPNNQLILSKSDFEVSDLEMVIEEAAKICEEILLPLNHSGDLEGCIFEKGKVKTPKGFKDAYKNSREHILSGKTFNHLQTIQSV